MGESGSELKQKLEDTLAFVPYDARNQIYSFGPTNEHASLFNGVDVPRTHAYFTYFRKDFRDALLAKKDPIACAEALRGFYEAQLVNAGAGLDNIFLYKLATRLEAPEISAFLEMGKAFMKMGIAPPEDTLKSGVYLLNLYLHLYQDKGVSLTELQEITTSLSKRLPPSYTLTPPKATTFPHEYITRRTLVVDLLVKTLQNALADRNLTLYPDVSKPPLTSSRFQSLYALSTHLKDALLKIFTQKEPDAEPTVETPAKEPIPAFSSLPLTQQVETVLQGRRDLYWEQGPTDDETYSIALNLLKMSPTLTDYQALTREYHAVVRDPEESAHFRLTSKTFYKELRSPEAIHTCLAIAKQYQETGGDPLFFIVFLTTPFRDVKKEDAAFFREHFGGLGSLGARFKTQQEKEALEYVWDNFWAPYNAKTYGGFTAFSENVTELFLTLPQDMDDFRKKDLVRSLLLNLKTLPDLEASVGQIKSLFESAKDRPELSILLAKGLESKGTIERINLVKTFLEKIPKTLSGKNPFRGEERLNEWKNFVYDAVTPSHTGIISDTTLSGMLTYLSQQFDKAGISTQEDCDTFLKITQAAMQRHYVETLADPAKESRFSDYFEALTTLYSLNEHLNFTYAVNSMIDHGVNSKEENVLFLDRVKRLDAAIRKYVSVCGTVKEDFEPFKVLFDDVLRKVPFSRWNHYLDGYAEVFARQPQDLRRNFYVKQTNVPRLLFDQTVKAHENSHFEGTFPQLWDKVLTTYQELEARHPDKLNLVLLKHAAASARTPESVDRLIEGLMSLLNNPSEPATRIQAFEKLSEWNLMRGLIPEKSALFKQEALRFLTDSPDISRFVWFMLYFLSDPHTKILPFPVFRKVLEKTLVTNTSETSPCPMDVYRAVATNLSAAYAKSGDDLYSVALSCLLDMPDQWPESALVMNDCSVAISDLNTRLKELKVPDDERKATLEANLKVYTEFPRPTRMLNHLMLNQDRIHPKTLERLYHYVEYSGDPDKMRINQLPELLAMLIPYSERVHKVLPENEQKAALGSASGGLTRLYRFIYSDPGSLAVRNVHGIAMNNWAKIGQLGLSFTKWQYDAMRRWKGAGPSEKISLMEQSGLFKPLPAREDDKTFHGGYLYEDARSGLSIEMRRAYIVISKPGLGTLVIRNSSPVFGRNLLPEVGYFNPNRTVSLSTGLLLPGWIDFLSVMDKRLNQESHQFENHLKIKQLLDSFEEAMEPYVAWKCGFKDGKPPAGLKEILSAALLSTENNGTMSPFGKKKNIKLAWVNRYGLPLPVKTLSLSDPTLQQEARTCLQFLNRQRTAASAEAYEQQFPNLLAFLKEGLSKNLELVLSE